MSLPSYRRVARRLRFVAAFILAFPLASAAPDSTRAPKDFVWHVQGRAGSLYLAGSLHELRAGDRPSLSLYSAYARCDRVVFEADLAEFETPVFRAEVNRLAALLQGQTLSSRLDPVTRERIKVLSLIHI